MPFPLPASLRLPAGAPDLVALLSERCTAPELNSLLLEVYRRRAARVRPAELLAAYRQNRFVQPSTVEPLAFRAFELRWLEAGQAQGFQPLELSPLAPLGACSAVGTVHQDKVVSATRNTEVVADATNLLALESSLRRRAGRYPSDPLQYCAAHRHVRAQQVSQPGFSQHFGVFCLSTAGRDTGHFQFEKTALVRHISLYLNFLEKNLKQPELKITLKALDAEPDRNPLFDCLRDQLAEEFAGIPVEVTRMPQTAQGYYRSLQFGIVWTHKGNSYPIIDGGFTTWTQQLTGNRKERFLSSGVGIEFLWKITNAPGNFL